MLRNKAQGWPVLGPTLGKNEKSYNLNEVAQERDLTADKTPLAEMEAPLPPLISTLTKYESESVFLPIRQPQRYRTADGVEVKVAFLPIRQHRRCCATKLRVGPSSGLPWVRTKNPHNLNEVAQERDFTVSKTPPAEMEAPLPLLISTLTEAAGY
jgi:hypothetical protein